MKKAKRNAREIELRATRKLGQLLKATPKNKGAAAGGKKESPRGSYTEPRDNLPTYKEMGIDKKLAAAAQKPSEIDVDDRWLPNASRISSAPCSRDRRGRFGTQ
jgi:hypothetical protein